MSPDAGRAAFRFAVFVTVTASVLVVATPSGSAEHVVSWLSLGVGVTMIAVVWVLARRASR